MAETLALPTIMPAHDTQVLMIINNFRDGFYKKKADTCTTSSGLGTRYLSQLYVSMLWVSVVTSKSCGRKSEFVIADKNVKSPSQKLLVKIFNYLVLRGTKDKKI